MRFRSVKKMTAVLAAVVVLAGAAGCATEQNGGSEPAPPGDTGTHAELVTAAQAEGKVVWYTPVAPDKADAVAAAFDNLYGIKVEYFRSPSSKIIQRYESERDANAPVADVVEIGSYTPILANANDWVTLTSAPLESLKDWPETGFWGEGIAVKSEISPLSYLYNTELVSESDLPTTWEEFVNTNIGDIATPNMANSDVWIMLLDFLDATYGEKVLTDFAKAERTVYDSSIPASQSVASGEHFFGIGTPSTIDALVEAGAPITYFVPNPTTYASQAAAVAKNAPHPSAGLLFMDFLMSHEGQVIRAGTTSASVRDDVTEAIELGADDVPLNEERGLKDRERLIRLAGF